MPVLMEATGGAFCGISIERLAHSSSHQTDGPLVDLDDAKAVRALISDIEAALVESVAVYGRRRGRLEDGPRRFEATVDLTKAGSRRSNKRSSCRPSVTILRAQAARPVRPAAYRRRWQREDMETNGTRSGNESR